MSTQATKSNYGLLLRLYYKRNLSSTSQNKVKTLAILSYRIFLSHNLLITLRSLVYLYEFVCLLEILITTSMITYYIATFQSARTILKNQSRSVIALRPFPLARLLVSLLD